MKESVLLKFDVPEALRSQLNLQPDGAGGLRIVLPELANMAADTVGRWVGSARRDHPAMVFEQADGKVRSASFAEVDDEAARLAQSLRGLGVGKGDRVAVHTGLRPETGVVHLALYKLGAIAVTLSQLYGVDTLRHVLDHSEARLIVTQDAAWQPFRGIDFAHLAQRIVIGERGGDEIAYADAIAAPAAGFVAESTRADDPALLMYTSGSTGLPKGMLHGHRILQAYLPSIALFFNLDLNDDAAVFWSPADWAWVGGLLDLLLAAWAFGHTVVTSETRFDAEWAFDFMARQGVTHTFLTPTALKRMAEVRHPRQRWPALKLRVVCTGGEALPGPVLAWCENELGVVCNEFYGLTEVNHLIGNCRALAPTVAGSMGLAYPGHGTTIVDEHGTELPPGEVGEIVTRSDDPTQFLGYWRDPERTAALRLGARWLRTGDLGFRDANGYFWYHGRADDLIKSAGYRIGPAEVEECLLRHPAVAEAAVLGVPDTARGQIVRACVRLKAGQMSGDALTRELQQHVKTQLAAYKYPREVIYVDRFEMTSSGKIDRKRLGSKLAGAAR
ncbi:MAG: AMP-binding protein [Pseudomonadota bacterium]|nr:AMP-binding protein [Pseudomonadota bacterium]